jgi:hypothetical protein
LIAVAAGQDPLLAADRPRSRHPIAGRRVSDRIGAGQASGLRGL